MNAAAAGAVAAAASHAHRNRSGPNNFDPSPEFVFWFVGVIGVICLLSFGWAWLQMRRNPNGRKA
jgi:biotin transporter BioY